ncbi:MAG: hypothetical protein KAY24_18820, partial [Candidatus Eisenbacteria sp.]|nr:hypothetical protein [Candidatus Eisenbacteria bacterium]
MKQECVAGRAHDLIGQVCEAGQVYGLMNPEELAQRVHSLRALPKETEWVEFKESKANPQEIGE